VYAGPKASEEDKAYWEATPAGEFRLGQVKESVAALYETGACYYIETSPVPASALP